MKRSLVHFLLVISTFSVSDVDPSYHFRLLPQRVNKKLREHYEKPQRSFQSPVRLYSFDICRYCYHILSIPFWVVDTIKRQNVKWHFHISIFFLQTIGVILFSELKIKLRKQSRGVHKMLMLAYEGEGVVIGLLT